MESQPKMSIKSIINLIFPMHCPGCKKPTGNAPVCDDCLRSISVYKTVFCGKCRSRLAENKKVCHKSFYFVLGAAADYDNKIVKGLICLLKFKFVKSAAAPLAKLLALYVGGLDNVRLKNFVVVPVPLSTKRLRERGFNQSELIAKKFSELLSLELQTKLLFRGKNTRPQSETGGAAERKINVRGCFAINDPALLLGKNVILVDDVITSGATLIEAAGVLKAAGAHRIIALVAAMA